MAFLSGRALTEYFLLGAAISTLPAIAAGVMWLVGRTPGQSKSGTVLKSKWPMAGAISVIVLCCCVAAALVVNRYTRIAEHQPPLLSRAGIRAALSPLLELAERRREKRLLQDLSSFEPIDAHTHISGTSPTFINMLEQLHLHVLDILYVDDTNAYRSSLEGQRHDALNFVASAKGHAAWCTSFDPFHLTDSSFTQNAIDGLNHSFEQGAVAAKVWKNIGMEIKNPAGKYIMPDDPIFEPIYKDIEAKNKTLIIHAADRDAAWDAKYPTIESANYYRANPKWNMAGKRDVPQKQEILLAVTRAVAANPNLMTIGAHLGSMENLAELGQSLDGHPNFAVDTAARLRWLATQPREAVRSFLVKYQDRILYGSDLSFDTNLRATGESQIHVWERQYALDWRYLSTADNFDYYGYRVRGLDLPQAVLKKIYHDNAVRWIPGIVRNVN